jgi:hypothetical protein
MSFQPEQVRIYTPKHLWPIHKGPFREPEPADSQKDEYPLATHGVDLYVPLGRMYFLCFGGHHYELFTLNCNRIGACNEIDCRVGCSLDSDNWSSLPDRWYFKKAAGIFLLTKKYRNGSCVICPSKILKAIVSLSNYGAKRFSEMACEKVRRQRGSKTRLFSRA